MNAYIRGAVAYARENGTDGLDALTYFIRTWCMNENWAENAVQLLMA